MSSGTSQGLFVIVAVVIFGIFVSISYLIFQSSLRPKLASIFENGFLLAESAKYQNIGYISDDIKIFEKKDAQTYVAKIRNTYDEHPDIYVEAVKTSGGGLRIVKSGTSKDTLSNGNTTMTGSIAFPDKIDGLKITYLYANSFSQARFTKDLKLPAFVETIGTNCFRQSVFEGSFNTPDSLKEINGTVFYSSLFTGLFNSKNIEVFGDNSFYSSTFKGDINTSKVRIIEGSAFYSSVFTGVVDLSSMAILGYDGNNYALGKESSFSKVVNEKDFLKVYGSTNIRLSDGSYWKPTKSEII